MDNLAGISTTVTTTSKSIQDNKQVMGEVKEIAADILREVRLGKYPKQIQWFET